MHNAAETRINQIIYICCKDLDLFVISSTTYTSNVRSSDGGKVVAQIQYKDNPKNKTYQRFQCAYVF